MKELVKQLDPHFNYVGQTLDGDTLMVHVESDRAEVKCPYCGQPSSRVHAVRSRILQDLPVMANKTKVELAQRKMKCTNPECSHATFTERFECFDPYARRTKRLDEKALELALNTSALSASFSLKDGICSVSKSTLCGMLKKRGDNGTGEDFKDSH